VPAYHIDAPAAKLVAITIDRWGNVTPIVRSSQSGTSSASSKAARNLPMQNCAHAEIVARVRPGHSGIVAITRAGSRFPILIPLGTDRPFLDSEIPPNPGADGAYSLGNEMRFYFEHQVLSWRTNNLSGSMRLLDEHPSVELALRLSVEDDGEIDFAAATTPLAKEVLRISS
jgi:hypothetical protein